VAAFQETPVAGGLSDFQASLESDAERRLLRQGHGRFSLISSLMLPSPDDASPEISTLTALLETGI